MSERPAFEDAVLRVLRSLGPGEVVTYGEVAAEAGYPGAARAVGHLLARSGDGDLPWWRVVTATGRLVPGNEATHAARLRAEGVAVVDGRVAPAAETAMGGAAPGPVRAPTRRPRRHTEDR